MIQPEPSKRVWIAKRPIQSNLERTALGPTATRSSSGCGSGMAIAPERRFGLGFIGAGTGASGSSGSGGSMLGSAIERVELLVCWSAFLTLRLCLSRPFPIHAFAQMPSNFDPLLCSRYTRQGRSTSDVFRSKLAFRASGRRLVPVHLVPRLNAMRLLIAVSLRVRPCHPD